MVQRRISREQLIELLREIKARGWIDSVRPRSAGGVGNTIEQLLGFPDNNLPIADTSQWELKSHRRGSSSLITLLHAEPHPRPARIIPRLLLPHYGWPAEGWQGEMSFRQTIRATNWSDRGVFELSWTAPVSVSPFNSRRVLWKRDTLTGSRRSHSAWATGRSTLNRIGHCRT